jgi:signal transduction histidine kinase
MGITYLKFGIPTINLIVNIILFTLITLNYTSTWKLRLIAVTLVYTILLSVESIVFISGKILNLNHFLINTHIDYVIALYSAKMLSYIVMLALSNFKMIRNKVYISVLDWISVFLIPLFSLILFCMIMSIADNLQNNFVSILISISILLIINIFVFYLYDTLKISYQERLEKKLLQQQNNAYIKQFELINQSQENIRMFRHDMKHHLFTLHTLVEEGNTESALQYLKNTFKYMDYNTEYAKSGNSVVDSILNYKLQTAKNLGIEVSLTLDIPTQLNIQPFDMSVILGNLLDNAIEATLKLKTNKKFNVSIEYDRNVLYISMANYYHGTLLYLDNKLITTKEDKKNHGLGLTSVRKSLENYNGTMNIYNKGNMFYIDVLLFNSV